LGWSCFVPTAAIALSACGAGQVAEAVRPKEQTAVAALGEDSPCREVEKEATPLVVDWRPEDRGDLEIAMKQGIAVVSYDCHSIHLLRDCQIPGSYGYVGTSLKESIVRLDSADELKANLPFGGASIAGKIGAGLERSATLDIALEMVGRVSTTWREPARADLVGDCEGATHFVRAAYVGAYAMSTGTKAHAAASVQMFGAGASGDSDSARSVDRKDGNVDDCRTASPTSNTPPAQCGTALRLDLSAIRAKAVVRPATTMTPAGDAASASASAATPAKEGGKAGGDDSLPDVPPTGSTCPHGMVSSGGKCTAATDVTSFTCDPGDLTACTAQCDKGDAASCFNAAYMYDTGKGADQDDDKANALYDKACSAGFPRACTQLAQFYFAWHNGQTDDEIVKSVGYATKACDAGQPEACSLLGYMNMSGAGPLDPDVGKALPYYERGCGGGDPIGCVAAGMAYTMDKDGRKPDWVKSLEFNRRGCDGGNTDGCVAAVTELLEGHHVARDPKEVIAMTRRLCDRFPEHCSYAGMITMYGIAGWRDDRVAYDAFSKGCAAGEQLSCAFEARMRLDGRGAPADEDNALPVLKKLCDVNKTKTDADQTMHDTACGGVAHAMQLGKGTKKDPRAAYVMFAKLCDDDHDDDYTCTEAALALRDGIGVAPNKAKAMELFKLGCDDDARWDDRDPRACHARGVVAQSNEPPPKKP
jgi:TPR repeat protein